MNAENRGDIYSSNMATAAQSGCLRCCRAIQFFKLGSSRLGCAQHCGGMSVTFQRGLKTLGEAQPTRLFSAELTLIQHLECVFRGNRHVLVHQLWLNRYPPLVIRFAQLSDHIGVLTGDIFLFARVGFQIKELGLLNAALLRFLAVPDQVPTRGPDTAIRVLILLDLAAGPAPQMRHQVSRRPVGLRVLHQRNQAAAFDLLLNVA